MYELIDVDILNKSLPAVVVDGVEFLVGVQIANLVGKGSLELKVAELTLFRNVQLISEPEENWS